jgi:hypothetical protein
MFHETWSLASIGEQKANYKLTNQESPAMLREKKKVNTIRALSGAED